MNEDALIESMTYKVFTVSELAKKNNIQEVELLRIIRENPLLFDIMVNPLDIYQPNRGSISYRFNINLYNWLVNNKDIIPTEWSKYINIRAFRGECL